ncbi:MAG: TrkA C-terminal domain-containing protein [Verrucomicrobiota bacterium]
MIGIIGIAALLTILGLSLLITRLATVALTLTGLSYEAARFQARSVFTGTGYTTSEAETVMEHPVRRRIIMALMLLRSAGIVSIILSLILSFMGSKQDTTMTRLLWLVGGVAALWLLSLSRVVDKALRKLMQRALTRWTNMEVRDYVGLLKLSGDYVIRELKIKEGDWLAGKNLTSCRLREEGVTIIGIYRSNGSYVGVPQALTRIKPGDTLILYGRSEPLSQLDQRESGTTGDRKHQQAVNDQQQQMKEQKRQEEAASGESIQ